MRNTPDTCTQRVTFFFFLVALFGFFRMKFKAAAAASRTKKAQTMQHARRVRNSMLAEPFRHFATVAVK